MESDDDPTLLDERIEALTESLARCRKIAAAAKIAIVAGLAWLVLGGMTLVSSAPELLIAAAATVIGGIVVLGSNDSTWKQMQSALAAAVRARMIMSAASTFVEDERPTLH